MHDRPDHAQTMPGVFAHLIGSPWTSADAFRRSLGRNMFALPMRRQCQALLSAHRLPMGIGGRVPPLEGRCMFARTMRRQCQALLSAHRLPMDIGGHVPPLEGRCMIALTMR